MNILAIDTTTRFLCLGIEKEGKVFQVNADLGTRHSEMIIPKLKALLKKANVALKDIDYIVCGVGPGSFTGIRIGLSTAKGLAYGVDKPLVGIPSLDILAHNAPRPNGGAGARPSAAICPIIDARRQLVYSAVYKMGKSGIKKISPYMLIPPAELLEKVAGYERVVFLGDGLKEYKDLIVAKLGSRAILLDEAAWYPKASFILSIARDLIAKKKYSDAKALKPIYLYPKDCQIKK